MTHRRFADKLGNRLRAARQAAGLTQAELAGNEMTRGFISQIENGELMPSLKTLRVLAAKLQKPMTWFLDINEPLDIDPARPRPPKRPEQESDLTQNELRMLKAFRRLDETDQTLVVRLVRRLSKSGPCVGHELAM